ncbi:predicted protein [Nematostella vectensis]|uniref:DNA-directed RNA polymerases I and III subunit RPAC1 n=1 Tax=Nematostella vectensis TaxID=45351 RepID=A7SL38_NEMVE|nr:predicted protein [Nematostella vectensis]|eukprot:XP_001627689.1 predicted protein [Nematostella vectensis]
MASMENIRTRVQLQEHGLINTHSSDFPGNYTDYDDTWTQEKFEEKFKINITRLTPSDMEFDMIGIDASVANAFRRILLAEVPTMAIEKVFLYNNTSIIQDEVLAHRLGLIPIHADPRLFNYKKQGDEEAQDDTTLVFELKVKCIKNKNAPKDATDPDELYINSKVTTDHLKWIPTPQQAQKFGPQDIRPLSNVVFFFTLQELDIKMHAVKGVGKDHAKFSPVGKSTASYRLLPEITLLKPCEDELADKLAACFSPGVIKVKTVNEKNHTNDQNVGLRSLCNIISVYISENIIRNEFVEKNYTNVSVESIGALRPEVLVCEAIKVLISKCRQFISELDNNMET